MASETIAWIANDGTVFPFDGSSGYRLPVGGDGRFAPTYNLVTEVLPNDGGTRLRNVVAQPRTITIPLEIYGDDPIATRNLWRSLVNACDPERGDGFLRFTPPDGSARGFVCRYSQGLEGDDGPDKSNPGLTTWVTSAQFVAFDPMPQDAFDTTNQWQLDDGGGSFFPLFPLVLTSSTIFAEKTIAVLGDKLAWPLWTVTGPGSNLIVTNRTTEETFSWGGTLDVGESLTIDTRPPSLSGDPKSVRDNLGIKRYTELTAWDLWSFTPGNNVVHIEFDDATTDSLVVATWRHRWGLT